MFRLYAKYESASADLDNLPVLNRTKTLNFLNKGLHNLAEGYECLGKYLPLINPLGLLLRQKNISFAEINWEIFRMQFLIQFTFFVAFIEFLHLNPVVVVSSDLNLYKTVPIKPLSDQECGRYGRFLVFAEAEMRKSFYRDHQYQFSQRRWWI